MGATVLGRYDLAVVGGGIVGLSTARAVAALNPRLRLVVLEKELEVARHQSGRNSGVLHSGLYYRPGSLKARLCRDGRERMERFCLEHGLPVVRRGKVIVALDERELPRLSALHERGRANGVEVELVGPERLAEIEPHAAGLAALHVPGVAVTDFAAVCGALRAELERAGHTVLLGARVDAAGSAGSDQVVRTSRGEVLTRLVVNCAGLQSDRVARVLGIGDLLVRIVPFRGEYRTLVPDRAHLVRGLIYPLPDPALPFLGVHATRGVDGIVACGPNAVLSLSREGYRSRRPDLDDLLETFACPGFARLALRHARTALAEAWRSLYPPAFGAQVRRLLPEVRSGDLRPGPCGIRAQAVARDGNLVDDFVIEERPGVVHVLNAPSPAATAALAIGEELARRLTDQVR